MKSKKKTSKEIKDFTPTKKMYKACSFCLENEIKAYIVPVGAECQVELNYKNKIKRGDQVYDSQIEASMVIWKLYESIYNKLKKKS